MRLSCHCSEEGLQTGFTRAVRAAFDYQSLCNSTFAPPIFIDVPLTKLEPV